MKETNHQTSTEIHHPDLCDAEKLAYIPSGLVMSNLTIEPESQDYGACEFDLNHRHIKLRVAKITPKKVGQFVTLWKRKNNGPIIPYELEDPIDLFVISVRTAEHFGQFVFPKKILSEKGILSSKEKKGKLAIRVYPPWDTPNNKQAEKTQAWQLPYFFEIDSQRDPDTARIQKLFL